MVSFTLGIKPSTLLVNRALLRSHRTVLSSFASLQKLALRNLSVSYEGLISIVETCTNLTVRGSPLAFGWLGLLRPQSIVDD